MGVKTVFINHIPETVMADFADVLTSRKSSRAIIIKELNCFAVYYRDYQGGHYDYMQSVKFTDFGYKVGNEEADIKHAFIWMQKVYKHLPSQYKNAYARKCNEYSEKYLNQSVFILAKKEDYKLLEEENQDEINV